MAETEIKKSDLIDVIEYELDYRDRAHKAELEKITSEKNAEIEILKAKLAEIEILKAKLAENGIEY